MKLIDKSALVAEIKRRIKFVEIRLNRNNSYTEEGNTAWKRDKALHDAYNFFLSFLDTFEAKEVDLDFTKEVDMWIEDNGDSNGFFNVQELAKHFFELGIRASQPTTSVYGIEEALKENGIDPDSKEADMYREAIYKIYDRLKVQKGEKV